MHDEQRGHEVSTERSRTLLSFLDLAAGMVEVADAEGDHWDMKDVSVLPTARDVRIEWRVPICSLKGLLYHFLPALYWHLNAQHACTHCNKSAHQMSGELHLVHESTDGARDFCRSSRCCSRNP